MNNTRKALAFALAALSFNAFASEQVYDVSYYSWRERMDAGKLPVINKGLKVGRSFDSFFGVDVYGAVALNDYEGSKLTFGSEPEKKIGCQSARLFTELSKDFYKTDQFKLFGLLKTDLRLECIISSDSSVGLTLETIVQPSFGAQYTFKINDSALTAQVSKDLVTKTYYYLTWTTAHQDFRTKWTYVPDVKKPLAFFAEYSRQKRSSNSQATTKPKGYYIYQPHISEFQIGFSYAY